jgi:hypothetical protein
MQEIWIDIKDYEGLYQISNYGNIKAYPNSHTHLKEIMLKPTINSSGYLKVELYKNHSSKVFYVHRLVALSFISNPENKPQVNHIDGNKTNNKCDNLEWVTISENQKHAINKGLRKPSPMIGKIGKLNHNSKKIIQYDLQGNYIRRFDGIAEAARYINGSASAISANLNGRTKSSYGYIWKEENTTI